MKLKMLNPNKKMAIVTPNPMYPSECYFRQVEGDEVFWYRANWEPCTPDQIESHRLANGEMHVGLELAWLRGTR